MTERARIQTSEEDLQRILEQRRELVGKIGTGEVKAVESVENAARIGRLRARVTASANRIERKLERLQFEETYQEAEELYRKGFLLDEEIEPHRQTAARLGVETSIKPNKMEMDERLQDFIDMQTEVNKHLLITLFSATLDDPLSSREIADKVNDNYPKEVTEWGTYGLVGPSDITSRMRTLQDKLYEEGYSIVKVSAGEERKSGYLVLPNDYLRSSEYSQMVGLEEIKAKEAERTVVSGARQELQEFLDDFRYREKQSSWPDRRDGDIQSYGDESLYALLPEELDFKYSAISRTFSELASLGIRTKTALAEADLDNLKINRIQSILRRGNVGYKLATILQNIIWEERSTEEER